MFRFGVCCTNGGVCSLEEWLKKDGIHEGNTPEKGGKTPETPLHGKVVGEAEDTPCTVRANLKGEMDNVSCTKGIGEISMIGGKMGGGDKEGGSKRGQEERRYERWRGRDWAERGGSEWIRKTSRRRRSSSSSSSRRLSSSSGKRRSCGRDEEMRGRSRRRSRSRGRSRSRSISRSRGRTRSKGGRRVGGKDNFRREGRTRSRRRSRSRSTSTGRRRGIDFTSQFCGCDVNRCQAQACRQIYGEFSMKVKVIFADFTVILNHLMKVLSKDVEQLKGQLNELRIIAELEIVKRDVGEGNLGPAGFVQQTLQKSGGTVWSGLRPSTKNHDGVGGDGGNGGQ